MVYPIGVLAGQRSNRLAGKSKIEQNRSSTQRYQIKKLPDEDKFTNRIINLSSQYGCSDNDSEFTANFNLQLEQRFYSNWKNKD